MDEVGKDRLVCKLCIAQACAINDRLYATDNIVHWKNII